MWSNSFLSVGSAALRGSPKARSVTRLPVEPSGCPLGRQHSEPLNLVRDAGVEWGPDAGVKGRVREEALELARVDRCLEEAGRAEHHTGVDRGPPRLGGRGGQNQTQAHGRPDSGPRQGPHG